jgi:hypothetical protein
MAKKFHFRATTPRAPCPIYMQTIEQIPPETEKTETFTDDELASFALAETQPEVAPAAEPLKRGMSVGRAVFWVVVVLGSIALGLVTLAMVAIPVIGC